MFLTKKKTKQKPKLNLQNLTADLMNRYIILRFIFLYFFPLIICFASLLKALNDEELLGPAAPGGDSGSLKRLKKKSGSKLSESATSSSSPVPREKRSDSTASMTESSVADEEDSSEPASSPPALVKSQSQNSLGSAGSRRMKVKRRKRVAKNLGSRTIYSLHIASKVGVGSHRPHLPDPPLFVKGPYLR